jgi:hypothetical protein
VDIAVHKADDDGRRISLIIARSGRNAIGVEDDAGETQPPVETMSAKPNSATVTENPPTASLPRRARKGLDDLAVVRWQEARPSAAGR